MSDLETLDAEISRLQQEATAVERAPPSFDERWPPVEAELLEAEAIFRQHGPQLGGVQSMLPEHVHQRQLALLGAVVVANKKALIDSERARVKARTADGIAGPDKARRLDQLRVAILKAAAKRELAVREIEPAGEFMPRPVHPELLIYKQAEVERLAR